LKRTPKKCVLLIIDGLGDLPIPELGGKTPLEAANTPVLDRLATAGAIGLVDPVGPGVVPNTHSGTGLLFGVYPSDVGHIHRGPVEAAGAGHFLEPGEIALRVNFATLEDRSQGLKIIDRRAGRITAETRLLAAALADLDLGDGIRARLWATDQHRGVLLLTGPGLDGAVSDTDPGDRGASEFVLEARPGRSEANLTARKVNRFVTEAHRLLSGHPLNAGRIKRGLLPANGILTRGAGAGFHLPHLLDDRQIATALVAGCNTVRGMGRILGFKVIRDARFTADAATDLDAKMGSALAALERCQMVYLHVKAPDIFSHDRQPQGKRDFIERLDRAMAALEGQGALIALAADHTTDSNSGKHTADPVPALIHDPDEAPSRPAAPVDFGETACRNGSLPRQSAHEFLLTLLKQMGY
jgi:2,3-bisphosphoglycerate-independent phosphoglycerate mutase